jgi:hypothetical protein
LTVLIIVVKKLSFQEEKSTTNTTNPLAVTMVDKPTDPNDPSSPALVDLSSTDNDVQLVSLTLQLVDQMFFASIYDKFKKHDNSNPKKMIVTFNICGGRLLIKWQGIQNFVGFVVMTMVVVRFDNVRMVIML